ncbi:uncharacterized protein LOC109623228 [Aedes albopictus]|uniref:Secreted protein n=1 Tax=Aedes albopictus TaxID=7160 RepID=A0ABM1YCD4_AEDAL
MKRLLVLGVALMATGFANCDLGLKIAIQGVPNSVSRAIGAGVQPVIAAKMTISINETLDSSGVLKMLRSIASDVVVPLESLLAGINDAASDKSGDSATLFENLNGLVESSAMALSKAQITVVGLQSVLNPTTYQDFSGNLTHLAAEVNSLVTVQSVLLSALNEVNTADPPYTARNVSMVITSDLISIYTTSLKSISSALSTLGSLISTIVKEKQATILQKLNLNDSVDTALKNLIQVVTNFNRTSYGVYSSAIRASDNSLKSLNQAYAPVLSKASTYNNGNMTNLMNFLANASTVASVALDNIRNNTAALTLQLAYTLGNQTTNISQTLYNGIQNISDTASTSTSTFSRTCERKYTTMFQQPGLSPSRLNLCLQSEGASLASFAQVTVPGLFGDVLRWVGPQVVRINMCSVSNGTCSVAAFDAISDFSSRLQMKYDMMSSVVIAEQNLSLYRIINCVDTVSNDIQDGVLSIQDKSVNCLTTGT